MDSKQKSLWIHCPICGGKTRTKVYENTVLVKFPLYTLPLLKDVDCCPLCSGALSKQILRVVVYHERRADKVIFVSGWYCAHCEVPLIDQEGETDLLRRVAPGMVYIFDAKSCRTPQELLNRAKEKILVRELPKAPERPAPKETEKLNDVQVPDVLSNLSYEPNTKVWVYAERCHCAACQKKYGRDMMCFGLYTEQLFDPNQSVQKKSTVSITAQQAGEQAPEIGGLPYGECLNQPIQEHNPTK